MLGYKFEFQSSPKQDGKGDKKICGKGFTFLINLV